MDVAEILRRSNQASLDSLVPLIKIQTRTDMKRYAQNGYSVGITAKEFSENIRCSLLRIFIFLIIFLTPYIMENLTSKCPLF